MPSYKKSNGEYQDIAYPIDRDLRKDITNKVLQQYNNTKPQHNERTYEGPYTAPIEQPSDKAINKVRGGSIDVTEDDLPF